MATKRFDYRLNFLLSMEERGMLWELAGRAKMTPSDTLRHLIRGAYEQYFHYEEDAATRFIPPMSTYGRKKPK